MGCWSIAGSGGELGPYGYDQSNLTLWQLFLGTLVDEDLDLSAPRTQQTAEKRQSLYEKVGSCRLFPYLHLRSISDAQKIRFFGAIWQSAWFVRK